MNATLAAPVSGAANAAPGTARAGPAAGAGGGGGGAATAGATSLTRLLIFSCLLKIRVMIGKKGINLYNLYICFFCRSQFCLH